MKTLVLAVALTMVAFAAIAQQQPPLPSPDSRIAGAMVQALNAEIVLRDAALKAVQEDAAKREQEWKDWFKPWCEAMPGCAPVKLGESK